MLKDKEDKEFIESVLQKCAAVYLGRVPNATDEIEKCCFADIEILKLQCDLEEQLEIQMDSRLINVVTFGDWVEYLQELRSSSSKSVGAKKC